jgi:hypothetical protein
MLGMVNMTIAYEMLSACRPRKGGPFGLLRDAAYKIGREHGRDDHRGVARIGKVVHRPAEHLALAHAGVQGIL